MGDFNYKKYLAEGELLKEKYNDDDRYEVDGSSVGDGKYEDEESELQKEENYELEPEDMDNPDEDLVIIGSGYLDIKSKFGERPSQTNGEYAALGQKVVDQLHKGDKEAALDYIYSQINEDGGVSVEESESGVPGDKFKYFRFLDGLRDSGQTNMFGAGPYLETYFGLDKREAREVLTAWMKSFDEPEEKKSKFKKTGEESGFDMRGINELTGYDDPKYPKSKHHKANNEMIEFAKALGKADVKKDTMEEMFHKMGTRLAQKFGK